MTTYKTIEDFFKRKRTIRNKNLIIKIEKNVYRIKEATSKEINEPYITGISLCEDFCDFYKQCIEYSNVQCKLEHDFFLQEISEIECLILSNKK